MYFISIEGIDGSGKTTIIQMIKQWFLSKGQDCVITREPGGVSISESIRSIILDKNNNHMSPWTEALLYIASRKQHLDEVVIPNLKNNKIVISDRFMDSTSAYQGYARGIDISDLDEIQNKILNHYIPDLTLFFDIDPIEANIRIQNRGLEASNRIDLETIEFHKKVYNGYKILASHNYERIKIINARLSIEKVYEQCIVAIKELLNTKND